MSKEHEGRRKPPQQSTRLRPEIVGVATQAVIRAMLDALFWWIDRGGRL